MKPDEDDDVSWTCSCGHKNYCPGGLDDGARVICDECDKVYYLKDGEIVETEGAE